MTSTEFEKRWAARRVTEARLIAAEEGRIKARELGARADMVIAKLAGKVFTKNITVPMTGARRVEIKSLDAERGTFLAYASSWHERPDRQGDVVAAGAFSQSIRERPQVPMLWSHSYQETIGKCTHFVEDSYGLKFKGEICRGVRRADEALLLLKSGCLDSFSIGYGIEDSERRRDGTRILKSIALYEVSIVPVAADVTARIVL